MIMKPAATGAPVSGRRNRPVDRLEYAAATDLCESGRYVGGGRMHLVFRREVFRGVPIAAQTLDPVLGVAPHGHGFAEIAVVARGTATHVSGGERWPLRPGSALVIRPGMWHGYEDCHNLAVHNVYVGSEVFHRELSWVREDPRLG